jgi:SsrA-binding protein
MARTKANKQASAPATGGARRVANRKAFHDYHIIEKLECGLALEGTEIKSIRAGLAKIDEGYARLQEGELWLIGVSIAQYPNASGLLQHEPLRNRKLLIHRRQIEQIKAHVRQKGKTLVPLAIYFKGGWAKCEIGIAEGKREFDKRDAMRTRDQKREITREMHRRNR